jgi:lipopolysaccharide/colanic/teichoic acid biosynthesis glycosyltransferase
MHRGKVLRFAAVIVLVIALLAVLAPVFADSSTGTAQVPDAAAYILGPTGLATIMVIRETRKRRAVDGIRRGVGVTYLFAKRCKDLLLSTAALLAASPLFALIALLVRLDSPGPIIHKRYVIGKGGRIFPMFKFRTMVEDADRILEEDCELRDLYYNGNCKLKCDPRVTRLGKFLRKTSLDELPQLINIFLGQMAFVGPRPITRGEVDFYGPSVERFKTVTPGITGLWQTSGRSETSYARRVELDMLYIEKRTILFDVWLILATLPAVMLRRGAF